MWARSGYFFIGIHSQRSERSLCNGWEFWKVHKAGNSCKNESNYRKHLCWPCARDSIWDIVLGSADPLWINAHFTIYKKHTKSISSNEAASNFLQAWLVQPIALVLSARNKRRGCRSSVGESLRTASCKIVCREIFKQNLRSLNFINSF